VSCWSISGWLLLVLRFLTRSFEIRRSFARALCPPGIACSSPERVLSFLKLFDGSPEASSSMGDQPILPRPLASETHLSYHNAAIQGEKLCNPPTNPLDGTLTYAGSRPSFQRLSILAILSRLSSSRRVLVAVFVLLAALFNFKRPFG